MNEKMILEEARYQLNFVTEEKESVEIEGFLLESLIELIENKNKKIEKLENDIKEWFDIADNILRATDKYGEISIGEVADYISKLQKELDKKDKVIDLMAEVIEECR